MTKAQRHMERVAYLGCIVCRNHGWGYSPAQVHHLLKNGKRIGHYATIPLCWAHHQSAYNTPVYVSRHPHKREFERRYGTEQELLAQTEREMVK